METLELRPGHPLYVLTADALGYGPEQIWARRSIFNLQKNPLLVSEVFLPDLPRG